MTEAKIKEELSVHFFSGLAARMGYTAILPRVDEGVDLMLQTSLVLKLKNRTQVIPLGKTLSVQLKTTTEKRVVKKGSMLLFDLDVKNCNDLIFRKNSWYGGDASPLVLVLLMLTEQPGNWVTFNNAPSRYCLNGLFYWFFPEDDADFSDGESTKRIQIPLENQIDLQSFDYLYNLFFKN